MINALATIELLERQYYSRDNGNWYIETPSPILPIAMILQNGEIVPTTWEL